MPSVALGKECICRVACFAEHRARYGTRQSHSLPSVALGKELHSAKSSFAECRSVPGTWQSTPLGKGTFCRAQHSAKSALGKMSVSCPLTPPTPLSSLKKNVYRALNLTLGKEALCRVLRPGTRQRPSLPSVTHGTRQSIFVFFEF